MSQPSEAVIRDLYSAFAKGDVAAILAGLDADVVWHSPESLPHGGDFRGRDQVGSFFEGIGKHWESLDVELKSLLSDGDQVIVLVDAHGRLRATGEDSEYRAAHAWTLRDGAPVRFDEFVDAPASLPAAHAAAH